MVNLDKSVITISVTDSYRPALKTLANFVNQNRSFSGMIGLASLEYVEKHKPGDTILDDFTNTNVVALPQHYACDKVWRNYLNKQDYTELKSFWKQYMRIGGLLNKALEKHKDE